MQTFFMILLLLTSLFLITLILIQRGRGGGLAGAFGGMGGQSAFGAKAGDVFTRVTIGVAAFWILLCVASIVIMSRSQSHFDSGLGAGAQSTESETGREFVEPPPEGPNKGQPAAAAPAGQKPATGQSSPNPKSKD